MRKFGFLFAVAVCIAGCQSSTNEGSIKGEIKGLTNDTIYLYSMGELNTRIDTIYANNGQFSHTFQLDTITSGTLLLNKGKVMYPVFLDKGNQIEVKGNLADDFLTITGNSANEELNAFLKELKGLAKPSEKALEEKAESFIRQHHSSLASVYLLDKYFIQKKHPDYVRIKKLISLMSGSLQDQLLIENVSEYADRWEGVRAGKPAPYFNLPNAKGENISRLSSKLKDKYVLLTFWSCDGTDSIAVAQLRSLNRKYGKNKNFALLGISMDYDKKTWLDHIKKDTLSWEQLRDTTGWDSETAKRFAVITLPTHLLISPSGEIVARDIEGDSLSNKIKEVLKK